MIKTSTWHLCLAMTLLLSLAGGAQASCGDRPGTPKNLTVIQSGSLNLLAVLKWENRASEKVWWDFEITDGNGVRVDSARAGTGRGVEGKGVPVENSFSIPENGTRCFRVKARTATGTQGCVSEHWSNQACLTVGKAPALLSGPDTCKTDFVWRQAVPNDHVCVSTESREDAKRDNASAAANRVPGASGPNSCKVGLVWREAVPNDLVCVGTKKRNATKLENSLAATNKVRP